MSSASGEIAGRFGNFPNTHANDASQYKTSISRKEAKQLYLFLKGECKYSISPHFSKNAFQDKAATFFLHLKIYIRQHNLPVE